MAGHVTGWHRDRDLQIPGIDKVRLCEASMELDSFVSEYARVLSVQTIVETTSVQQHRDRPRLLVESICNQ